MVASRRPKQLECRRALPDKFNPVQLSRRLGVLISGRGSNLQSLIDATAEGRLNAEIAVVISNDPDAGGLERARNAGIEALAISHRGWPSRDDFDHAIRT
jgi:phosphoribosylglycinamide formyltransferase-1